MSQPRIRPQYRPGGQKKEIGEDMFGVVLWSDPNQKRAVIWCEDHGDLAFFNGDGVDPTQALVMDPGDLVQFDLCEDRHIRLASNAKLVASEEYPTLANDLKNANDGADHAVPLPKITAQKTGKAKIIAFERKPTLAARPGQRARQAI